MQILTYSLYTKLIFVLMSLSQTFLGAASLLAHHARRHVVCSSTGHGTGALVL